MSKPQTVALPAALHDQSGEDVDEGRLACAVGAEQAEDLAARNVEADIVERELPAGVGLRKRVDPDRGGSVHIRPHSGEGARRTSEAKLARLNAPFTLSVRRILREKGYRLVCDGVGTLIHLAVCRAAVGCGGGSRSCCAHGRRNPSEEQATEIRQPASVRLLNDLNFGYLSVTTAGTAVINPNTDALTTTGGVVALGGNPYSALFESVSPIKGVVIVRIPKNPITIVRVGGTETMTVSNWTIDGSNNRNVNSREPFSFKVGGTLFVNANQVEGFYIGTFTVDVQYP